MKILYIGELYFGSTCLMRMETLKSLGQDVTGLNTLPLNNNLIMFLDRLNHRLNYKFDFEKLNNKIIDEFIKQNFDIVWIDKGKRVYPVTLKELKKINPKVKLVHINPDDPFSKFRTGWKTFIDAIPFYDVHFVAREVNISEYKQLGAKRVYSYDRAYDPEIHKPIKLNEEDREKYYCKVGFIGSWAKDRERTIAFLIDNNVEVAVWGNGWNRGKYWNKIKKYFRGSGLKGIEYSKAINGMEIALHFLRKENRDEQDSRTFEIPACGTFMLAEKTKKHIEFFKENEEAVFFDNDEELLKKVNYYLINSTERIRIANNGYKRSKSSGYTYKERLSKLLTLLEN